MLVGLQLFIYLFIFKMLGRNSVSPEGINTEPSRGQRKIKRGEKNSHQKKSDPIKMALRNSISALCPRACLPSKIRGETQVLVSQTKLASNLC